MVLTCNKIELFIKDTFYLKMISYRGLVPGKEYSINSPDGIYKRMIFYDYDETYNFGLTTGMAHEYMMWTYGTFIKYHDQKNGCYHFGGETSVFYDPEEIKKNMNWVKGEDLIDPENKRIILPKVKNGVKMYTIFYLKYGDAVRKTVTETELEYVKELKFSTKKSLLKYY